MLASQAALIALAIAGDVDGVALLQLLHLLLDGIPARPCAGDAAEDQQGPQAEITSACMAWLHVKWKQDVMGLVRAHRCHASFAAHATKQSECKDRTFHDCNLCFHK